MHLNLARLLTLPMVSRLEARRFEQVKREVTMDVLSRAAETRKAYFQAVAAEETVRYMRQVKQTAEASAELARRMEQVGNFSKLARAREQAFYADAALGLARADQAQRASRERLARLTAVMSLLEGHADVVMDDVGPQIVPSVDVIRARFGERRAGLGNADRLLRRLMGLEAKMRQYRDGAVFVRGVQEKVGVDGFNAVWQAPDNLPTPEEIQRPQVWVERVHGSLFR